MSASGVVSIAFAKTGFVLLRTIPSEMLPPSSNDLIEMLKDSLTHLASQTWRAVVLKIRNDIETSVCGSGILGLSEVMAVRQFQ